MKIKWVKTGDDPNDLKAEPVPGDMLRVERMSHGNWWYCCYIGDERFEEYPHATTMKKAKEKCIELYKKHKNCP